MRYNKGFVLFSVLIFMQLYALLGIYSLMSAKLSLKTTEQLQIYQQAITMAERTLAEIETSLLSNTSLCQIPVVATYQLINHPIEWWQENACQTKLSTLQNFYVIEKLESDPCAVIINANNQRLSAQYYRVTLNTYYQANRHVILQSTLAVGSNQANTCPTEPRIITPGRQTMNMAA